MLQCVDMVAGSEEGVLKIAKTWALYRGFILRNGKGRNSQTCREKKMENNTDNFLQEEKEVEGIYVHLNILKVRNKWSSRKKEISNTVIIWTQSPVK